MLRINWQTGQIPIDYDDPYLELIRLLTEAAGLEHSLMVAYLYGLFSLNEKYSNIRGNIDTRDYLEHSPAGRGGTEVLLDKVTFLDVALEEMQHLSLVNRFLAELCAAPNFIPHIFPYSSDLYPFDIVLRSIDRYTAATYLWIEADECKLSLDPKCEEEDHEPYPFIEKVRDVLHRGSDRFKKFTTRSGIHLNHVGSLYRTIVKQLQKVAEKPPSFLDENFPWGDWEDKMNWIIHQGEIAHYDFFRTIFTGKAFNGKDDGSIWKLHSSNSAYPSRRFVRKTAYSDRPDSIPNEDGRRLAWLSNLHYWIILSLLDSAYRDVGLSLRYVAIDQMTMGLWHLGLTLARMKYGLPFDPMGPHYHLGRTPECSLQITRRLIEEAARKANELSKESLLPSDYNLDVFKIALAGLDSADIHE
jgi:hypothetical protein